MSATSAPGTVAATATDYGSDEVRNAVILCTKGSHQVHDVELSVILNIYAISGPKSEAHECTAKEHLVYYLLCEWI